MSLNGTYKASESTKNLQLQITDANVSNGTMNCKVTWNATEGPQTASGPGRFRYVNSNQQPTGICFWVIQRGNSTINMATFGFSGSTASATPNKLYLGGKMTKITPSGSVSYANFDFQDWLKIS